MKRFVVTICVFLFTLQGAAAQPNLNFKRVTVPWPTIELYFSVGCNGAPAYDMTEQNFRIFENGVEVEEFTLVCPDPSIRCAISAALVFDASMSSTGIALAKAGGRAFVDLMDGVHDEAAIIFFNSQVYIAQQMTTIKPLLYSAVDGLPASGGTAVLDGTYAGVLELINKGVNQCRVVIVLTDGYDNSSTRTIAEIISLANRNHIRIFTIGLGSSVHAGELEQVALLTGGRFYHTANTNQLTAIYQEISTIIFQGFQECMISYVSDCADGARHEVALQLVGFCGGMDEKMKTYRAPLDSATFTELYMDIGERSSKGVSQIVIPLDLVTPPHPARMFYPLSFLLRYDTSEVHLVAAETPAGSLLENIAVTVTDTLGGSRVETTGGVLFEGSGKLMDLRFEKRVSRDTVRSWVHAEDVRFARGCLTPVILRGGIGVDQLVTIVARGPLAFCEGDSVTLEAPVGYVQYSWSTGDTTESVTVSRSGVYTVTVRNAGGFDIVSGPITVTVHAPPAKPSITQNNGVLTTEMADAYQWYRSGSVLAGETRQILVLSDTGSYSVKVTSAFGCSATSDPFIVTSTGIEGVSSASTFDVYPDPSDGIVQILLQAEAPERWNVTVTNVLGQVFFHYQEVYPTTRLHQVIDIRSAPPGLYLLRVRTSRNSWMRKIIKR